MIHIVYIYNASNILLLTLLSPGVTLYGFDEALAEKNHMKAKQALCDLGTFSESECQDTGSSSIITKVVDVLISAMAEKNRMKAKQALCDNGTFSESECQGSTITTVMDSLIEQYLVSSLLGNPNDTITNSQVETVKEGNTVLTNEMTINLTPN